MINRDQLADAMTAANIMPQDVEILERMFTMFDKMGAAAIDYREFLAGLAPLVRGDVKARVFVRMRDVRRQRRGHDQEARVGVDRERDEQCGVVVRRPGRDARRGVDALCENVFLESKDGVVVNYGEVVHQIVEDPAFRTFLAGQGSVHYG